MIKACQHDELEVKYNFVNNAKKMNSPKKTIANRIANASESDSGIKGLARTPLLWQTTNLR
jgi:hypothetical protein